MQTVRKMSRLLRLLIYGKPNTTNSNYIHKYQTHTQYAEKAQSTTNNPVPTSFTIYTLYLTYKKFQNSLDY